jgi:hypothetical protein
VGSHGGRVWIYDLSTTTTTMASSGSVTLPLKEWTLSNAPIVKLDFVGALNRLVVASENHVGVYPYEYQSGKPLFHVEFDLEMKEDRVTSMSCCCANLIAVGQASGKVLVWDWELQTQVASFDALAPVQRIAFAPHQGTTSPVLAETPKAQPALASVPVRTPNAQPVHVPVPTPVRTPKAQPVTVPVRTPKAQPLTHQLVVAAAAGSNNNNNRALPQTRLGASPDTTQQTNPTQPARQENVVGIGSVQVQDMIRDEVDRVREDMQDAFRNLHVDMLRQFQIQSEDLNFALAKQLQSMDRLSVENRFLREENKSLQQENGILRNR